MPGLGLLRSPTRGEPARHNKLARHNMSAQQDKCAGYGRCVCHGGASLYYIQSGVFFVDEKQRYADGLQVRREVLGDAHVDRSLNALTEFNSEFQE